MKIALYFMFLLLFISCAGKELVVRNADTMLEYQVNKRLPLNERQKEKLSTDIDAFLNAEKKVAEEMLPIIDQINLDQPENVRANYKELEVFYRRITRDFSSLMAKYMVQLDQKQKDGFFRNMKDENRKYKKKTQDERRDDTEEKLEKFVGTLTYKQKEILKSYDPYYKEKSDQKLKRRIKLHSRFKEILDGAGTVAEKEDLLMKAYLLNQDDNFADSKIFEITMKIIPTLSAEQKETFRDRAKEVKEILRYFMQSNY